MSWLLWQIFLVALIWQSATPQTLDSTMVHQLGLLLGLPVDREQGSLPHVQQDVPKFVKDIHECLSSNQTANCIPGYSGDDLNVVRTFLGIENHTPPLALHSNKELKNSLAVSFDVPVNSVQIGMLRYAMLRVYRQALSADELASLQQNCTNLTKVNLQLYTQTGLERGSPVFSLRGVQSLSNTNFTSGGWVEFHNLTRLYRSLVNRKVQMRFVVSSRSCPGLSPSELGFSSVSENRAQLVGFEEEEEEHDREHFHFPLIMSLIAKEHVRSRRQVPASVTTQGGVDPSILTTEAPPTENFTSTATAAAHVSTPFPPSPGPSTTPANPSGYERTRCGLYRHEINFANDLGWNFVLTPRSISVNFCAGHCHWPVHDSDAMIFNWHSIIQSYASFVRSTIIPPPCCVPHPDGLKKVRLLIKADDNTFQFKLYSDMVATQCTCM